MPLSHEQEVQLEAHYRNQDHLAQYLGVMYEKMSSDYLSNKKFSELRASYKTYFSQKLEQRTAASPLVINLVDIQNDFVLEDFALYATGGENTVTSNMALLDAIIELEREDESIKDKLKIITSQDAHRFGRDESDQEYKTFERVYGKTQAATCLVTEQTELKPFGEGQDQYGLHCIIGTVGAGIATPIAERLETLMTAGLPVTAVLKINFSAPVAGLSTRTNQLINITDPLFRNATESLFLEDEDQFRMSYLDFLKGMSVGEIIFTGICGNVCVQEAAEGVKKCSDLKDTIVTVHDSAVHYLVKPFVPGLSSIQKVRTGVNASYDKLGVEHAEFDGFPPNPECSRDLSPTALNASDLDCYLEKKGDEEAQQDSNVFFEFYLAHSSACDAVLVAISVAAVVLLTMQTLGLGTLAVMAVAAVTSASIAGFGTFFYQEQQRQAPAEEGSSRNLRFNSNAEDDDEMNA